MTRPRLVGLSANVQRPSKTRALVETVLRDASARTALEGRLFDLFDPATLANKPVAIVATGGGARHALVVEHASRPLFGFLGALQLPTAVYASGSDFTDGALTDDGVRERVAQAGTRLAFLLTRGIPASEPIALAAAR